MKKFLCLVLCIVLALSFTACGKKASNKSSHSVDVQYFAKLGQINDLDYRLGGDVEESKAKLAETLDDHEWSNYFDFESDDYTVMTDGTVFCCYKTENADAGITHIAKCGDAYGFSLGSISTQVRDTMSEMGFDATERNAKRSEIFFLPTASDMTVLEYEIKDCTILFVFQEHALCAAVITK